MPDLDEHIYKTFATDMNARYLVTYIKYEDDFLKKSNMVYRDQFQGRHSGCSTTFTLYVYSKIGLQKKKPMKT